jgi:hypothetical protein
MNPPPLIFVLLAIAAPAYAQQPRTGPEPAGLIEKARQAALHYTAGLPDFICTQLVQRFEDAKADNRWSRKDVLTIKLSYFNHLEDYKLTHVDGKPTLLDFNYVEGPTTRGEFGTLLLLIFHPRSQAEFRWKAWSNIHKRRVAVYTYKITKDHSGYLVSFGEVAQGPNSTLTAYHGEIDIEPESGEILRATQVADLPGNFPITQSVTRIEYDYRDVGGRPYLLPIHAEVNLESLQTLPNSRRSTRYRGRNLVEFKDFRKFQTETTITFGTVDDNPKPPEKK